MTTESASSADRKHALAEALEQRLAQGYKIESQDDTQAILTMKGRKRMFRTSSQSRQLVTIDETGSARFEKMD